MKIPERRKYQRYDTEVKVYFQVNYDVKTVVKFQVVDRLKGKRLSEKHKAVSKNVSAEGLCFTSATRIKKGDMLCIEVYLPKNKKPILMDGEVRWCKEVSGATKAKRKFDAGIKIISVNGEFVPASIFRDDNYKVTWSILLESVLGNFQILSKKRKKVD